MNIESVIFSTGLFVGLVYAFLKFDYTYWFPGIILLVLVIGYCIRKEMYGKIVE